MVESWSCQTGTMIETDPVRAPCCLTSGGHIPSCSIRLWTKHDQTQGSEQGEAYCPTGLHSLVYRVNKESWIRCDPIRSNNKGFAQAAPVLLFVAPMMLIVSDHRSFIKKLPWNGYLFHFILHMYVHSCKIMLKNGVNCEQPLAGEKKDCTRPWKHHDLQEIHGCGCQRRAWFFSAVDGDGKISC